MTQLDMPRWLTCNACGGTFDTAPQNTFHSCGPMAWAQYQGRMLTMILGYILDIIRTQQELVRSNGIAGQPPPPVESDDEDFFFRSGLARMFPGAEITVTDGITLFNGTPFAPTSMDPATVARMKAAILAASHG